MNPRGLLLLDLALAFYNVGTIWAHELDIFRTWKLVDRAAFHTIQRAHFRKLPYWIFAPVGLALAVSATAVAYHPPGSPAWAIAGSLGSQLVSALLTAAFWGRWQAALSRDPRGPDSYYLERILATHWVRTLLINLNALVLALWALRVFAGQL